MFEPILVPWDVAYWHKTDMPTALRNVRSRGQTGRHMLVWSFSAFDPERSSEELEFGLVRASLLAHGNRRGLETTRDRPLMPGGANRSRLEITSLQG